MIGLICSYCNINDLFILRILNKEYKYIADKYIFSLIELCTINLPKQHTSIDIYNDIHLTPLHLWNLYLMLKNLKIDNDIKYDDDDDFENNKEYFLSLFSINSYNKKIDLNKWNGLRTFSLYNKDNDIGIELDSCKLNGNINFEYCPNIMSTIRIHNNPLKMNIKYIEKINKNKNIKLCAINLSNCCIFGELISFNIFPLKLNTLELQQNNIIINLDTIKPANKLNEFYFVDISENKNIYGSNINIQRIFGKNNNLKHLNLSQNKINGTLDLSLINYKLQRLYLQNNFIQNIKKTTNIKNKKIILKDINLGFNSINMDISKLFIILPKTIKYITICDNLFYGNLDFEQIKSHSIATLNVLNNKIEKISNWCLINHKLQVFNIKNNCIQQKFGFEELGNNDNHNLKLSTLILDDNNFKGILDFESKNILNMKYFSAINTCLSVKEGSLKENNIKVLV